MWLNEIFKSPQGEGTRIGMPSLFVRLAGCNIGCVGCDTDYQHGVTVNPETLAKDIAKWMPKGDLVITGGEPMIQYDEVDKLVNQLRRLGDYFITVETAGANVPTDKLGDPEIFDLYSVSPKILSLLPGTKSMVEKQLELAMENYKKYYYYVATHSRAAVQYKFVWDGCRNHNLFAAVVQFVKDINYRIPVIFQPMAGPYNIDVRSYCQQLASLQRKVYQEFGDFRVLPQLHKLLNVR
jgi:7-carboxy-7-deazaguanine synthase